MSRTVPKSLLLRQARRLSPATQAPTPTLGALISQFTLSDNFDETTLEEQYELLKPLLTSITLTNVPFDTWTSNDINVLKHHLDAKAPLPWKFLTDDEKRVWYLLGFGTWGPRKEFNKAKPNDIQWNANAKVSSNHSDVPKAVTPISICSNDRIEWEKKKRQLDPLTISVGVFASMITLTAFLV
ncbi:Gep7 [Kluyveromyces lactis]|nr:Gep7 [Kluyveromyces lactis]